MRIFVFFLLIISPFRTIAQELFSSFFAEGALRIDYFHAGNSTEEFIYLDELIAEPFWGGSKINLIDTTNQGEYFFEIFDKKSSGLIYSRGYSTLFSEWQTTEEAQRIQKSFSETLLLPFPKNEIIVAIYSRRFGTGHFDKVYTFDINPEDLFIKRENRLRFPVAEIENNGIPSEKVDIVILPEGYRENDMEIFMEDCKKFTNDFFSFEPYKTHRKRFNIWAVLAPSEEQGADIPKENIWRKTILNCSYYSLNNERYLMTADNKSVRDLAANVPYDQIYILVNSPKYGGGGIFNHYCVSVNGHESSGKIHVHEFGHGFINLADEYVGTVSYSEMYNLKVEPPEANITTLVDFDRKWKMMVDKKTPVPTPVEAAYIDKIGVFEGAGYVKEKMYRPAIDCLMNTFKEDVFCPVCCRAIENMIDFYTVSEKNKE